MDDIEQTSTLSIEMQSEIFDVQLPRLAVRFVVDVLLVDAKRRRLTSFREVL